MAHVAVAELGFAAVDIDVHVRVTVGTHEHQEGLEDEYRSPRDCHDPEDVFQSFPHDGPPCRPRQSALSRARNLDSQRLTVPYSHADVDLRDFNCRFGIPGITVLTDVNARHSTRSSVFCQWRAMPHGCVPFTGRPCESSVSTPSRRRRRRRPSSRVLRA